VDVNEQLNSAGVLEAIKIRKQGYSIRRSHDEFVKRYQPLTPQIDLKFLEKNPGEYKKAVFQMITLLSDIPDAKKLLDSKLKLLQVGISKVFMKEEVKDCLESKLNRMKYINRLQSKFRGWRVYRKYAKFFKGLKKVQAHWKGITMRLNIKNYRRITKYLQSRIRFYLKRRKMFKKLKELAKENRLRREQERLEKAEKKRKELERLEEERRELERKNRPEDIDSFDEKINRNKNKKISTGHMMKVEKESTISPHDSNCEVSTSVAQMCDEIIIPKKQTKNKKKFEISFW